MAFRRKNVLTTAAVVLALALSSCSADEKPESSSAPTTVESSTPESTPEPTTPEAEPTLEPTPELEATLSPADDPIFKAYEEQKKVDKKFVKDMRKISQLDNVRDKTVVPLARLTCENLDNGLTFAESVESIQNEADIDDLGSGVLINASIATYCPEHTEMRQNSSAKASV